MTWLYRVRWRNFRGFRDTGWLEIRPITVLIGPNNSGKTSLIAPLLLMKQTVESPTSFQNALLTRGELLNAGFFRDIAHEHREDVPVTLSIEHHVHDPDPDSELQPVGQYQPGAWSFTFGPSSDETLIALRRYDVFDLYRRPYLTRELRPDGNYTLRRLPRNPLEGAKRSRSDSAAVKAMLASEPINFLFVPDDVTRAAVAATKGREPVELSRWVTLYTSIVNYVQQRIRQQVYGISYVGPLREAPKRVYLISGEMPPDVGPRGEFAAEIIFRRESADGNEKVNEWLRRFEFAEAISPVDLHEGAFSLTVRRTKGGQTVNFADTGFGMSQVLPLLVQGIYGLGSNQLVAEQPEIHLNPRLQALLADVFVEFANNDRSALVETHSEHLLLRLRRLVAEGAIDAENVALYYVETVDGQSTVREVPIQSNGHIEADDWPRGFFEETLRDSLALASAQVAKKADAVTT